MSAIAELVNAENQPYWDGLKQEELLIQQCQSCGYLRYPARWMCPECLSEDFAWTKMSGVAKVITFNWYMEYIEPLKVRPAKVPYNVAIVELEEGPILRANVSDVAFGDLAVGDKVQAVFDHEAEPGWTILRFVKSAVEAPR